MNAAMVMQTCPNEEMLAAFIDARLDDRARLEVIEHLADCGECRDIVMTANEYEASLEQKGGAVVPGRFNRRWLPPLAAAAAVIAVLFGVPSLRQAILPMSGMAKLVKAANDLPERPTSARLSGDFAYKKFSNLRGKSDEVPVDAEVAETMVKLAANEATEKAKDDRTVENLHAAGVGEVLAKNRPDAVKTLEEAASKKPSSAEIQNDLAAAYIANGDYERALAAARKSWSIQQSHAAAWNIALALDNAGRDAEAIAAWQNYLKLDGSSPWADEARGKLQFLQEMRDLQKK